MTRSRSTRRPIPGPEPGSTDRVAAGRRRPAAPPARLASSIRPVTLHGSTAIVAVPDDFTRKRFEGRLRGQLEDALTDEFGYEVQLAVTVDTTTRPRRTGRVQPVADGRARPADDRTPIRRHVDKSTDRFVDFDDSDAAPSPRSGLPLPPPATAGTRRRRPNPASIPSTPSSPSSSARPTASPTPRRSRSPRRRASPTTRCSSTGSPASARRTCSMPSATTCAACTPARRSVM